jgi:pimeloyl-ACP methyl ester carboxylesterase
VGTTGEITAGDGVRLAYRDEGEGRPVLLLHGMFASAEANWEWTGIGPALRAAGLRTIAPDARGHGASDHPTDPMAYADERVVADVSELLDHLGLGRCAVVGYSMGGLTAAHAVPVEPRLAVAVLAGVGGGDMATVDGEALARAMEADDAASVADPVPRQYREYAEAIGADLAAMAALQRGSSRRVLDWGAVDVAALVLAGEGDTLAGSAHELAAALPRARAATVPGDHATALLDPGFPTAIVAFLAAHP